jgi:hypothetical protein
MASPEAAATATPVVKPRTDVTASQARSFRAGPARAWVRICWREHDLRIEVANDGRNTAPSTGHGSAGMRERVRLYGGRLESGPRTEGGCVVRAYVPIGPAA